MKKKLHIGMLLDIFEPIWFKLGMIMKTAGLQIFVQVCVTMTLFKVMKMQERENFCTNYLLVVAIEA